MTGKIWNSVPTFSYMYNIHVYTYIKVPQDTEAAQSIINDVIFHWPDVILYSLCTSCLVLMNI